MRKSGKGCVTMCKKIRDISGLRPRDIYEKYVNPSSAVVDMKSVLDKMGIQTQCVSFLSLEQALLLDKNDHILGMAASNGDDLVVLYSKTLDNSERNYVLAHELGHCCLHLPVSSEFHVELKIKSDIYSAPGSSMTVLQKLFRTRFLTKSENEADDFAADLLISDAFYKDLVRNNPSSSAKDLSRLANVTENLFLRKRKLIKER